MNRLHRTLNKEYVSSQEKALTKRLIETLTAVDQQPPRLYYSFLIAKINAACYFLSKVYEDFVQYVRMFLSEQEIKDMTQEILKDVKLYMEDAEKRGIEKGRDACVKYQKELKPLRDQEKSNE